MVFSPIKYICQCFGFRRVCWNDKWSFHVRVLQTRQAHICISLAYFRHYIFYILKTLKILPLYGYPDSEIRENFAFGIRNAGIQLKESRIQLVRSPKVSQQFQFVDGNFNFTHGNFNLINHSNFNLLTAISILLTAISIYSQQFQFYARQIQFTYEQTEITVSKIEISTLQVSFTWYKTGILGRKSRIGARPTKGMHNFKW